MVLSHCLQLLILNMNHYKINKYNPEETDLLLIQTYNFHPLSQFPLAQTLQNTLESQISRLKQTIFLKRTNKSALIETTDECF